LARIERGMTVQIRFVPPPANQSDSDPQPTTENTKAFSTLQQIAPQLLFPPPEKAPILEIPPPEPEKPPKQSKQA